MYYYLIIPIKIKKLPKLFLSKLTFIFMEIQAAINAPKGSPGLTDSAAPIVNISDTDDGKAPIRPATPAETQSIGEHLNLEATATPIPAPVSIFATFAA